MTKDEVKEFLSRFVDIDPQEDGGLVSFEFSAWTLTDLLSDGASKEDIVDSLIEIITEKIT